ncbi:hypothetical protein [Ornithinimicrobium sediminis]|uniref:hypothetical protein n=1 Tax=Ornithinimicrobium sediminis TaxID=2904603 RepID=UPI001E2A1842|nr:hypothetical protein [Ornithinimicrobium sediminis]MCE0485728.1 hypothetical protein [Ornithinimicrobium sediminis]
MQTFDPVTGAVSTDVNVGWAVTTPLASISNDLQNTSRAISIAMSTSSSSGDSLSVDLAGHAGFEVGEVLTFGVEAGATYDMSKASGTSTDCSVEITYPGYSLVSMAPAAWQQGTSQGFFSADPIAQACADEGQDVTGFTFLNTPPYAMGSVEDGGGFGLLTNLLVSNYPTVTITYEHAAFSTCTQSWSETVTGNLTLLGFIKLGSFTQGAYGSKVEAGSDDISFTVTFTPSPAVTSLQPNLQAAVLQVVPVQGCHLPG